MEIRERISELQRQLAELESLIEIEDAADDRRPITERVKTFDDALDVLGENHPFVQQWWNYTATDDDADISIKDNADLIAYYKLRIITAALNEGWKPKFTEDEWRFYPWLSLHTKISWSKMYDSEKEDGIVLDNPAHPDAYACYVYTHSNHELTESNVNISSRLCYKTDELARYSGQQFADLWTDYYLIRK